MPDRLAARKEAGDAVDLDRKVRFLGDPASYPERPLRVDLVETHYSLVFLTDRYAYKLKKPLRGDGFDFGSVAARRANAIAETRLNRRLAPDVYLAIVPLTLEADGQLAIGGPGAPVDWLVKMVRLAADRMLDRRLAAGNWHYREIEALGWRLAAFFAHAPRARPRGPYPDGHIRAELQAALAAAAAEPEAPHLLSAVAPVVRRLAAFMARRGELFRGRLRRRRLVDGHGDLRPEHICLDGEPRVIDCLEFRADLRQLDPLNEIAYLALECRRAGGPAIAAALLRRYRARTGDRPPGGLLDFYTALNALVRARLTIRHLAEPGAHRRQDLMARADAYLAIAAHACRRLSR